MKFVDFFNALLEGKLIGQKCLDCNSYTCPPKATCEKCGGRNLETVELNGKGKVVTFTTTYIAPKGYENEAPYVVAMVELDEGPWIIGRIEIEPEKADKLSQDLIGRRVTVTAKEFPTEMFYPMKDRRIVPIFKLEED